jgi:hypothetical protein
MDALKNGVIKGNTYLCVGSVTTPKPAGLSGGGGSSGGRAGGVGSRKTKMLNSANHLVSPTFGGILVAFGILTAIHL